MITIVLLALGFLLAFIGGVCMGRKPSADAAARRRSRRRSPTLADPQPTPRPNAEPQPDAAADAVSRRRQPTPQPTPQPDAADDAVSRRRQPDAAADAVSPTPQPTPSAVTTMLTFYSTASAKTLHVSPTCRALKGRDALQLIIASDAAAKMAQCSWCRV
jgi:hypothetical protein